MAIHIDWILTKDFFHLGKGYHCFQINPYVELSTNFGLGIHFNFHIVKSGQLQLGIAFGFLYFHLDINLDSWDENYWTDEEDEKEIEEILKDLSKRDAFNYGFNQGFQEGYKEELVEKEEEGGKS